MIEKLMLIKMIDIVVCDRSCEDCSLWETNGREAFIPELSSRCLF